MTRMFEIIPAVDIQGGRAVRLFEGDPQRETVYFERPLEAALHWARLGAPWLHLVDLDAALGRGHNRERIEEIAAQVEARVQVGGGIRDLESARAWLERVDRVVLGTVAIARPGVVDVLLREAGPERLAVSVDARAGRVAVRGWTDLTETSALDLAERIAAQGVTEMIYTDVSRDGTMQGVDEAPLARLREVFPHRLLAGGGVGSDRDLETYERLGLDGAIVGRALYEGAVRYPRAS